jgi:hypothetical protein
MIEKLTEEQEKLLPTYRDKWMAIGLSTEPADHTAAEKACREAYIVAGLEPPKKIIWADSPLSGAIVAKILKNKQIIKKKKLQDSVRVSVGASVGDSVWDSVWADEKSKHKFFPY